MSGYIYLTICRSIRPGFNLFRLPILSDLMTMFDYSKQNCSSEHIINYSSLAKNKTETKTLVA